LTPYNTDTPGKQATIPLPSQHIAQADPDPDSEALTPLACRHIKQEEERDWDNLADRHKNPSEAPPNQSSLAAQQELEEGSRLPNCTYIDDIDDSVSEQASDDSQDSAILDVGLPADDSDDLSDQGARPDGQSSGQSAALLIQSKSETTQSRSRKRKYNSEGSRDSKRTHLEIANAAEVELGSSSLKYSSPFERRPVPNEDERRDQQPKTLEAGQDS
jgi:hypothetical protein